ncbi:MAG: cytochrome c biogenesis protein CcdA [Actinobacteria bacterium]|nr:cytochrome c biogenesis protein CcdA [Actinomycetota bacterium]
MNLGAVTFAFVAGTVASANPCGFALLPAFFLSYTASGEASQTDARRRVAQALATGGTMTLAFAIVFGVVGAGLTAGASVLMPAMPWATIAVGAALAAIGVAVLAGRHVYIRLPDPLARRPGGYRAPFLFGVGYAVASLSCTLPVFLSVVGASLGGAALLSGSAMFLAYAVGMGTVLTALTIAAVLARGGIHRALREFVPYASRVGGLFLLAAGLYLIYYWTFFLLPGSERRTAGKGPIEALSRLAERLQTWFASGGGVWFARVLLGLILLLAALVVWWGVRRRRDAVSASDQGSPEGSDEMERERDEREVVESG